MSEPKIEKPGTLERLIELQRINKEGATLKNVSDNMRALTACIAIAVAAGVAANAKLPNSIGKVAAVLWGLWAIYYSTLACIQSGFLFLEAVIDWLPARHIKSWPQWAKSSIAFFFAAISMIFMVSAFALIASSIQHVTSK